MKYRGVELQTSDNCESELRIGIEYNNNNSKATDKIIKLIWKEINKLGLNSTTDTESVTDDYILVRNHSFLNINSPTVIDNLKVLYDALSTIKNVTVNVDIQSDEWFEINGEEYNNDSVKWEEFIANLEI